MCATDIDDYIKRRLLIPSGMTSSGYVWSEKLELRGARRHDAKGNRLKWGKATATDAAVRGGRTSPRDSGDNEGYHAHAVASPKNGSGFVILTNGDRGVEVLKSLLIGGAMDPFL